MNCSFKVVTNELLEHNVELKYEDSRLNLHLGDAVLEGPKLTVQLGFIMVENTKDISIPRGMSQWYYSDEEAREATGLIVLRFEDCDYINEQWTLILKPNKVGKDIEFECDFLASWAEVN